jgi:hypothetical protein
MKALSLFYRSRWLVRRGDSGDFCIFPKEKLKNYSPAGSDRHR